MNYEDPHTHPIPESMGAHECSEEAFALVLEIMEQIRPEYAYAIAERFLEAARNSDERIYDLEQKIISLERKLHTARLISA